MRMTVYELADAAPGDTGDAVQRRRGRLKMLLVLAMCAAPVVASYFTYFVIRPEGSARHGAFIQPTRPLPAAGFTDLAGQPVAGASLKGQWLLVAAGPAACESACEKRLYAQRQLREMLGRERDRLDKLWVVTDAAQPAPALLAAMQAKPEATVLRLPAEAAAQWLQPDAGRRLDEHLYLVDPMGELMMRFPAELDPAGAKRDIERLLRASASWDRPGR